MSDSNHQGSLIHEATYKEIPLAEEIQNSTQPEATDEAHQKSKAHLNKESELLYTVEDVPPWHTCVLLGFQHYLTIAGSALAFPVLLSSLLCIKSQDPTRGAMICATTFVGGINTFLQTTLGVRLPIVQGSSSAYVIPIVTMMSSYFGDCPDFNTTGIADAEYVNSWKTRMLEVSGNIAVASLLQVFLGWTGIIGFMLKWMTPLTIAPTIALIGLALIDVASNMAAQNWPIAGMTMLLMLIFTQYLQNIPIPIPRWRRAPFKVYIFRNLPVLFTVMTSWIVCFILTTYDYLPEGNKARTDFNLGILYRAPWFSVPYPGQFGMPTVSLAGVVGIFAAVIASIFESIGDYHACAKITGAPPPPASAVNRGIFIEGIGTMLASLSGTAIGCTSYADNIGVIAITKVGSRRVIQYSALIMMLFGIIGKVGAIFVMIPEPIVGGLLCIIFSLITGMGISCLKNVNMSSARNIFILGSSVFIGLMIPKWLSSNEEAINTGSFLADQALGILLKTPMFIGGIIGFFLDNTIPGTQRDRGLLDWRASLNEDNTSTRSHGDGLDIYNLPFAMDFIKRHKWMRYFPLSPTFSGINIRRNDAESNP